MRYHFDAHQGYQLRAIHSVARLFDGMARETYSMAVRVMGVETQFESSRSTLDPARLLKNIQDIQKQNNLPPDEQLHLIAESADIVGKKQEVSFPNVSVEMETGTGKTYVYLRTALELNRRHGLKKFIVVVPSVAIREGVLKTFQITQSHFAEIFDNEPYRYDVYDSKNLTRLRGFAEDESVRFLIMTVDSFNKEQNVIGRSTDRLQGRIGLHMLQAVRPVLILDEPQNMESAGSKQALARLNPLIALRYSATHRHAYNRVYRVTPFDAYKQGLVKKIEVASVVAEKDENRPFVRVVKISSTSKSVTAKIEVHQRMAGGAVKPKEYNFKPGQSLRDKADRSEYEPYVIADIEPATKLVRFTNGVEVKEGEPFGSNQKELFRQQIRYTVEQHFRRQKQLEPQGVKVLSLFFIDKVENYAASDGLVRTLFAEAFNDLKKKYPAWEKKTPEEVSGAYFAKKRRKGGTEELLDSSGGESEQDRAAYSLIMKEKERLLSFAEPVSFLFSHSALREGWDNPNVCQICTLNQTTSEVKKRQEIGRGLRLVVNQQGERLPDEWVNMVTVVANESYQDYVAALQKEIEEDFGADEAKKLRVTNQRAKNTATKKADAELPPEFQTLWDKIKHKTRYQVKVNSERLIFTAVEDLNEMTIEPPKLVVTKARIEAKSGTAFNALQMSNATTVASLAGKFPLPNLVEKLAELLAHTQPALRLTRKTLLAIIRGVKDQRMILDNPEEFAVRAAEVIRNRLEEELVDGIQYEKDGTWYEQEQLEKEISSNSDKMFPATKSLYDQFVFDSEIERKFAERLESQTPVKFYLKLPKWFKVRTPVGNYNPDWALVWQQTDQFGEEGDKLYLVRETKGTDMYSSEAQKVKCGKRHFEGGLGVDYKVVQTADQLP
ncbi:MAG: DEAD/DEAH box helicase family protein [Gemmataceae bacterium]